ncbi:hypothetical protein J6590_067692 [Homalodisca vitripennis]|nr:hypothetical protein J6590_067692 [Homalodisca vitripennis]
MNLERRLAEHKMVITPENYPEKIFLEEIALKMWECIFKIFLRCMPAVQELIPRKRSDQTTFYVYLMSFCCTRYKNKISNKGLIRHPLVYSPDVSNGYLILLHQVQKLGSMTGV